MREPKVIAGPNPRKSSLDTRSYRTLTLPNALQVLLVSDKESKFAAASMNVDVGFFSDPDSLPGLAHLLEHVVLLGTEKYPSTGSFYKFILKHGGSASAVTSMESTSYQFCLVASKVAGNTKHARESLRNTKRHNNFYEGLSRFSDLFVAPLLRRDVIMRELDIIDAEHKMYVQNDMRRIVLLQSALSNRLHPVHKFGTGSRRTLFQEAKANNVDTPREDWVAELFSPIPNKEAPDPALAYADQPVYSAKEMGRICRAVSLLNFKTLFMSWTIPPSSETFRTKPAEYIAHLMAHKGCESLFEILKRVGWAYDISAYVDEGLDLKSSSAFELDIQLTKEGVENADRIILWVFSYLKMIKGLGVKRWIFEELAVTAENKFVFEERVSPIEYAQRLSSQMAVFPTNHWIAGSVLYSKYDPECILRVLNMLTPERLNVIIFTQLRDISPNRKEKYYGTEYHVARYPETIISRWNQILQTSDYRKQCASLLRINVGTGVELYYLPDITFRSPKASVRVKLVCPGVNACPESICKTDIFLRSIQSRFEGTADYARSAGAHVFFRRRSYGLEFGVDGFSDQIYALVSALLREISSRKSGADKLSDKLSELTLAQLKEKYDRFLNEEPSDRAETCLYNLLFGSSEVGAADFLLCLTNGMLGAQSDFEFATALFKISRAVMFVHGNVTEAFARKLAAKVSRTLVIDKVAGAERCNTRALKLSTGFAVMVRDTMHDIDGDPNSAIAVYFQIGLKGVDGMDMALIVTERMIYMQFMHEFRIRQSLAYLASVHILDHAGVQGLCFTMQSPFMSPDELEVRIEKFLDNFQREFLGRLSDDDFAVFRRSSVTEVDRGFISRSKRFWKEIESGDLIFDRPKRERAAAKKVTKQDVIDLFNRFIAANGQYRRKAVSLVYGNSFRVPLKSEVPPRTKFVVNVDEFRRTMPLYPATRYLS